MVLDPNNVDIQLSLGDLFMAQNDIDKAIKTYCDAIAVDPLNYLTYAKTGLVGKIGRTYELNKIDETEVQIVEVD